MWMCVWMAVAWARPLFVEPTPEGSFRVVEASGHELGAWHFAHFTNDRKTVNRLRLRLYTRRTTAIGCIPLGSILMGSGFAAATSRRRALGYDGGFDPVIGLYGAISVAGFAMMVVHPLNVLTRKPRWLRVDTHYTREEAVDRIRGRGAHYLLVTPTGIVGSF